MLLNGPIPEAARPNGAAGQRPETQPMNDDQTPDASNGIWMAPPVGHVVPVNDGFGGGLLDNICYPGHVGYDYCSMVPLAGGQLAGAPCTPSGLAVIHELDDSLTASRIELDDQPSTSVATTTSGSETDPLTSPSSADGQFLTSPVSGQRQAPFYRSDGSVDCAASAMAANINGSAASTVGSTSVDPGSAGSVPANGAVQSEHVGCFQPASNYVVEPLSAPGASTDLMNDLQAQLTLTRDVDRPSARRLARRLYHLEGFRREDVSSHLGRKNDFNQMVGDEYLGYFDFTGMAIEKALRLFLGRFSLVGETEDKERVLEHFSARYIACNGLCGDSGGHPTSPDGSAVGQPPLPPPRSGRTNLFRSQDSCHTLACAMLLLNTDLHTRTLSHRRMTRSDFIHNLRGLNDGSDYPADVLKDVYESIHSQPLPVPLVEEHMVDGPMSCILSPAMGTNDSMVATADDGTFSAGTAPPADSHSAQYCSSRPDGPVNAAADSRNVPGALNDAGSATARSPTAANPLVSRQYTLAVSNPLLTLPDPLTQTEYCRGTLNRKWVKQAGSVPTRKGRRGWKIVYCVLRDMVLYLYKDVRAAGIAENGGANSCELLRVHHALANRAADYRKRRNVFSLVTCDRAHYLFQASTLQEMQDWVEAINLVAARLSSVPLSAPISSQQTFQSPIYTSTVSQLGLRDQLDSHERQIQELEARLSDYHTRLGRNTFIISNHVSELSPTPTKTTHANDSAKPAPRRLASRFSFRRRRSSAESTSADDVDGGGGGGSSGEAPLNKKERKYAKDAIQFLQFEVRRYKVFALQLESRLGQLSPEPSDADTSSTAMLRSAAGPTSSTATGDVPTTNNTPTTSNAAPLASDSERELSPSPEQRRANGCVQSIAADQDQPTLADDQHSNGSASPGGIHYVKNTNVSAGTGNVKLRTHHKGRPAASSATAAAQPVPDRRSYKIAIHRPEHDDVDI